MHAHTPISLTLLIILLSGSVPSAGASSGGISHPFDADEEGWTLEGDNLFLWNGIDGNPDGCLEIQDDAAGPWSRAIAPTSWHGSYATFTSADSLIYEVRHVPSGTQNGNPPYVFRLEGPGGTAEWDTSPIPANTWNRLAAPFDESEWNVLTGSWNDLLQNVGRVLVAAEMITGDETVFIDNVCLTGTPSDSVYQECELAEFELGSPGWTATNASLATVSTAGNPGSYLRVTQTADDAKLLAPSWWYGDWSGLDGLGSVSFSFTFLGASIEAGRSIRLELSGPGGSAFTTQSTDGYVLPNRLWFDFAWPLAATNWTVTTGSWSALLADVTEFSLTCDYASGSDMFGLDNFARGLNSCPPPTNGGPVFYEPGYSLCGAIPFREASALAINPSDGKLYAAVDLGSSSGGGVYPLTGPDAGGRMAAVQTPAGLVFTADGDGFAANNNAGEVYRFVGSDSLAVWASTFNPGDDDPAGLLVVPPGFASGDVSAGELLVADHGNAGPDEVWVLSPDAPDSERLLVPDPGTADWYDLATDGAAVWLCDSADDDVLWSIRADGSTSQLALSQNIRNKQAFTYDPGQRVIYTVQTTSPAGLWRINPDDGQVTLVADGFDTFGHSNLEINPAGRKLWVADKGATRVYEICLPAADAVAVPEFVTGPAVRGLMIRPNPVRSGTQIEWTLRRAEDVRIEIWDASGRRVRRFDRERWPAGSHHVRWDGTDARGRAVAAGVYFIRTRVGDEAHTTKAVVVR